MPEEISNLTTFFRKEESLYDWACIGCCCINKKVVNNKICQNKRKVFGTNILLRLKMKRAKSPGYYIPRNGYTKLPIMVNKRLNIFCINRYGQNEIAVNLLKLIFLVYFRIFKILFSFLFREVFIKFNNW